MRTEHCPLCGKENPVVGNPLRALAEAPGKLIALVRGLTRAQLLKQPAPGKWCIQEIVCHLADAEIANAWRYRKIFTEDEFHISTYDQERWAVAHQYRRQDLRLALEQFRALRARSVALMKLIGRKAWARMAVHPTLGRLSLEQIIVHQVHHSKNHLAQIERIRKGFASREPGTPPSGGVAESRVPRPTAGGPRGKRRGRSGK
jgi:hypothetical protein